MTQAGGGSGPLGQTIGPRVESAQAPEALRIGFLGETTSANTAAWIDALRRQPGVDVAVCPPLKCFKRALRPWHAPGDWRRLRRWLADTVPDMLIGYRTTSYGFFAALTGVHPLVIAAQGESDVWPRGSLRTVLQERSARFAIRRADLIHAWGVHMAASLKELGASPEQLLVLSRGVDTGLFRRVVGSRDSSRLVVSTTRSLFPEYHVDTLLLALSNARQRGVPAELRIAGDGVESERLRTLAVRLGLGESVTFLGRVPRAEVASLLRQSHVYASTPETEGVSASLLEAMASGCVPIVTDLPGNREWVTDRQNGFLVSLGSAGAVAAALEEIWRNRDVWTARGAGNARMVQESGAADTNVAKFVASYRELVRNKQRAG